MSKIYRFSSLLLCFVLVSCTAASSSTPAQIAIPSKASTSAPLSAVQYSSVKLESIMPTNISNLAQVGSLGYGYAADVAWSPDNLKLAVATSAGIALYDTRNFQMHLVLPTCG